MQIEDADDRSSAQRATDALDFQRRRSNPGSSLKALPRLERCALPATVTRVTCYSLRRYRLRDEGELLGDHDGLLRPDLSPVITLGAQADNHCRRAVRKRVSDVELRKIST